MHDGIALERRGTPAAVICTDAFERMGRATAAVAGLSDYPFVLVPHPVASLTAEEISGRVEGILPQVTEILGVET